LAVLVSRDRGSVDGDLPAEVAVEVHVLAAQGVTVAESFVCYGVGAVHVGRDLGPLQYPRRRAEYFGQRREWLLFRGASVYCSSPKS
jgi:hypothetical protein